MLSAAVCRTLAVVVLCSYGSAAQTSTEYDEAVSLVRGGSFDQAIPLLDKLVNANPRDLKARNLLGIALSGAGRRAEANQQFESLLKSNPAFLPALKNLAHNELDLGKIDNAQQHFLAALKLAPSDPSIHFGLGHVEFSNGSYKAALHHYERSNGMHLQDPLALVRYAAACAELGLRDKSSDTLKTLPETGTPDIQYEAGVLFAKLERYEEAAKRFRLARAGSFDGYKSGFNLALAYLRSGDGASAARTLEDLLAELKPTTEIFSLLAQAYEKTGRTKDAYEALRRAIRSSPTEESPYAELVSLCLDHENQDLGLEIANIGVANVPRSSKLRLQRGVIHALDSRSTEATADFQAAIDLDPNAPLGYLAQALVLMRLDRNAEALTLLRTRIKAAPDDAFANWMLAEALIKLGPDAGPRAEGDAVRALERSIRSHPGILQSRLLLGKLLLGRGNTDGARVQLEKALELDAESLTASYLLGQVYRRQGRIEEANKLFAKVSASKSEEAAGTNNKSLLRIVRENIGASAR